MRALFFPRFRQVTGYCYLFWLAYRAVGSCCDFLGVFSLELVLSFALEQIACHCVEPIKVLPWLCTRLASLALSSSVYFAVFCCILIKFCFLLLRHGFPVVGSSVNAHIVFRPMVMAKKSSNPPIFRTSCWNCRMFYRDRTTGSTREKKTVEQLISFFFINY